MLMLGDAVMVEFMGIWEVPVAVDSTAYTHRITQHLVSHVMLSREQKHAISWGLSFPNKVLILEQSCEPVAQCHG